MSGGSITLADVATRMGQSIAMLEARCDRCDRSGRMSLDKLIAEHGADLPIPALRRIVAADCARMVEAQMDDPCGLHFLI